MITLYFWVPPLSNGAPQRRPCRLAALSGEGPFSCCARLSFWRGRWAGNLSGGVRLRRVCRCSFCFSRRVALGNKTPSSNLGQLRMSVGYEALGGVQGTVWMHSGDSIPIHSFRGRNLLAIVVRQKAPNMFTVWPCLGSRSSATCKRLVPDEARDMLGLVHLTKFPSSQNRLPFLLHDCEPAWISS